MIGEPLHYCSYSSNHLNMMNIGESDSEKRIQSSVKLGIDSHGSCVSSYATKTCRNRHSRSYNTTDQTSASEASGQVCGYMHDQAYLWLTSCHRSISRL